MDKPVSAINRYKASLREMNFVLFEQLHFLRTLLGQGARTENWGEDTGSAPRSRNAAKWVKNVMSGSPLNAIGR